MAYKPRRRVEAVRSGDNIPRLHRVLCARDILARLIVWNDYARQPYESDYLWGLWVKVKRYVKQIDNE